MEQTDLLYHHAEYGGDRASSAGPAVDQKVWCFLLLFVTLSNFKVRDNGNAIKQCDFQNS